MSRPLACVALLGSILLVACGGNSPQTPDGTGPGDSGSTVDGGAGSPDGGSTDGGTSGQSDGGDAGQPFAIRWDQTPADPTVDSSATFAFSCDHPGCAFQCAVDGAALAGCSSPLALSGLSEGRHTMHLSATLSGIVQTAAYAWTIDQTAPHLVSAGFDAYGEVALTFDEPIDPASAADLSRYSLAPALPSGMQITSAAVAGKVLTLGLSSDQLPHDYSVTATVQDLAGNVRSGLSATLPAASNGSRIAFLSAARGTGDLRNWAAVPSGSNPATGLQAADAICQAEASAAGFAGTFRAYLSDSQNDAACRMQDLDGKVSNNCNVSSAPSFTGGPWIGTDGLPVARTLAELTRGGVLSPIGHQADGTAVGAVTYAWHATDTTDATAGQALSGTCADWTTASTGTSTSTEADTHRIPIRVPANSSCGATNALLCFQVDAGGLPLNARYRKQGKVAFVTSTTTLGGISSNGKTGLAGADALCQSLASNAGLPNPSAFVAWLSDGTADAYCRVLGAAAKKSSAPACGLSTLPPTGPWVTATGFEVASNLDALVANGPTYPIFATETEGFPSTTAAWTGTLSDGTAAASNVRCNDWSDSTSGAWGERGQLPDTRNWSDLGMNNCNVAAPLLCLER